MDIQKPTTITTPTGTELTKTTDAQGNVVSDGVNDRILIGYQKTGFGTKDFGIKVSQEGYNVKTASNSQLVMSSAFNMFKIVQSGTTTITIGSGDSFAVKSVTIPHNLGVTPIVVGFVDGVVSTLGGPTGRVSLPFTQFEEYSTGTTPAGRLEVIAYFYAVADSTNVYMVILPGQASFFSQIQRTYTFKYYILQETSN